MHTIATFRSVQAAGREIKVAGSKALGLVGLKDSSNAYLCTPQGDAVGAN
jgi:hypothetical protein